MRKNNFSKFGFSIIEVLIGMFIFSIGLISILAIITSTLSLNDYNKNHIIASNLAREQLELFRNIRDSNYKSIHKYNQINPNGSHLSPSDFFSTGSYYRIENDYSPSASFPIKVEEITPFVQSPDELNGKMRSYRLCLDAMNRYVLGNNSSPYNCKTGDRETKFYRYIELSELKYNSGSTEIIVDNVMKLSSKVIWNLKGYHELEINTVIADWKRL